jgi:hypothetical protein|tara:strand:+ start:25 stop:858 length:834 start_codon:yes stop_codon:yes gene_type:complete
MNKVSNNKETDCLFPIIIKEFHKDEKFDDIESIVFHHFKKMGYELLGRENDIVQTMFLLICFIQFIKKPDWEKWDKSKTIKDYPHLIEHLDYPFESKKYKHIKTYREYIHKQFCNVPFEWMYSHECLQGNGEYLSFPFGIHYRLLKDEIDDFIQEELPKIDIVERMEKNLRVIERTRKTYSTFFIWGSQTGLSIIEKVVSELPINVIQYIITQLFTNFYKYRTGFPDLWMLKKNVKGLKLVEVKGIREQIKPHQIWWLNKLFDLGVDVSVMRVKYIK